MKHMRRLRGKIASQVLSSFFLLESHRQHKMQMLQAVWRVEKVKRARYLRFEAPHPLLPKGRRDHLSILG